MPQSVKIEKHDREVRIFTSTGTFVNGNIDFTNIAAGHYYIALHMNANLISAGTVTLTPILPDGTVAEDMTLSLNSGVTFAASAFSIIDFVGIIDASSYTSSSALLGQPIALFGGIRVTFAALAGASATNRFDLVLQRA